jgi:hypothetical protein
MLCQNACLDFHFVRARMLDGFIGKEVMLVVCNEHAKEDCLQWHFAEAHVEKLCS